MKRNRSVLNVGYLLILSIISIGSILADYDPCPDGVIRRATLGENCDFSDDCDGLGVVCLLGKCRCHQYYQNVTNNNGVTSCVKCK